MYVKVNIMQFLLRKCAKDAQFKNDNHPRSDRKDMGYAVSLGIGMGYGLVKLTIIPQ